MTNCLGSSLTAHREEPYDLLTCIRAEATHSFCAAANVTYLWPLHILRESAIIQLVSVQ